MDDLLKMTTDASFKDTIADLLKRKHRCRNCSRNYCDALRQGDNPKPFNRVINNYLHAMRFLAMVRALLAFKMLVGTSGQEDGSVHNGNRIGLASVHSMDAC